MNLEIENLLALLDDDLAFHQYAARENLFIGTDEHWADLVFRLRDEAVAGTQGMVVSPFAVASKLVHYKVFGPASDNVIAASVYWWMLHCAQPKHFIVAALIAKKMKEQRGDS